LSLVFFDIDGTLLLTGGAGVRAMTLTFERLFGVANAFDRVAIGGRTDSFLVSQALTAAGLADTRDNHERFRDDYVPTLAQEIHNPGTGRRGVMPGVVDLLTAIVRDGPFEVALLTGNYERAAHIKLAHFGLDRYFAWGVFGEESIDRDDLGRVGMARAESRGIARGIRDRAIVIGDTPYDIACAKAMGARSLAVATGTHAADELRRAGADVVVADLSETGSIVELLR
jgi:phosphoglycolate phosphatase-like HAD superfamily hydrolase